MCWRDENLARQRPHLNNKRRRLGKRDPTLNPHLVSPRKSRYTIAECADCLADGYQPVGAPAIIRRSALQALLTVWGRTSKQTLPERVETNQCPERGLMPSCDHIACGRDGASKALEAPPRCVAVRAHRSRLGPLHVVLGRWLAFASGPVQKHTRCRCCLGQLACGVLSNGVLDAGAARPHVKQSRLSAMAPSTVATWRACI